MDTTRISATGAVITLAAVLVTGCGSQSSERSDSSAGTSEKPGNAQKSDQPGGLTTEKPGTIDLQQVNGMVIDDGSGPRLCRGPVTASAPPSCTKSVPVQGLDLRKRTDVTRSGGVTYGQMVLTGEFRDGAFVAAGSQEPADNKPAKKLDAAELKKVAGKVRTALRGDDSVAGVAVDQPARQVIVSYEGPAKKLQKRFDSAYGKNVVRVEGVVTQKLQ